MRSILETCQPRPDLLKGTFNPEIFTASLSQVMEHYRGQATTLHNIYTDAEPFFREGTYPTDGLRMVLSDVFGRLSGDNNVSTILRLETAFGGGKTHTLISLVHLGFRGKELAPLVEGMMDPALLPEPGEVRVVGIAGDELPIHKPKGRKLIPYTLWGEIAYQVGGEALYRQVEVDVTSSGDLLPILNADIGSVDTATIEGGKSNAELADEKNPHPAGLALYELTWKTVFFHSLVGREQELGSNLFGITEPEALFEVSFPGMTPPQVKVALDEIWSLSLNGTAACRSL